MKIYIVIDTWEGDEKHAEYLNCTNDAEEALKIVVSNQRDGHKIIVEEKEISVEKGYETPPYIHYSPSDPYHFPPSVPNYPIFTDTTMSGSHQKVLTKESK